MLPNSSSRPTHISTVITTNQIEADGFKLCGRSGRCQTKIFPLSTPFHLVEDKTGTRPGIWVCSACNDYYLTKADTQIVSRKHLRDLYRC